LGYPRRRLSPNGRWPILQRPDWRALRYRLCRLALRSPQGYGACEGVNFDTRRRGFFRWPFDRISVDVKARPRLLRK